MIKNFNQFIFEQNNNESILIVCDVQKEFDKFIPSGFVKNIMEYCKKFTTVYQIWDSNKGQTKPSYQFPNQKLNIEKKYGTSFSKDLKQVSKNLSTQNPQENDVFKFKDADSTLVKVDNNHKWFYVNEKLTDLFKFLKGKNVILVGGAWLECLKDVYEALESYGVKVQYDKRYIYSAKTSNKQVHQINENEEYEDENEEDDEDYSNPDDLMDQLKDEQIMVDEMTDQLQEEVIKTFHVITKGKYKKYFTGDDEEILLRQIQNACQLKVEGYVDDLSDNSGYSRHDVGKMTPINPLKNKEEIEEIVYEELLVDDEIVIDDLIYQTYLFQKEIIKKSGFERLMEYKDIINIRILEEFPDFKGAIEKGFL